MQPTIEDMINDMEIAMGKKIIENSQFRNQLECADNEHCYFSRVRARDACDSLRVLAGIDCPGKAEKQKNEKYVFKFFGKLGSFS